MHAWRAAQLRAENEHAALLYEHLDAQTRLAELRLKETQFQEKGGTFQNRLERNTAETRYVRRLGELAAAENGLCFGRVETGAARDYIGRIALADQELEPILTDWRAPAAEPFYRATPATPGAVTARRHLRSRDRAVVDFEDDAFGVGGPVPQASGLAGEGALLAALTAARTGRMGDIVATIQAEQDRVIRSGLDEILVVQGGPGTGKTVVALHRAAYLLYTHRERLAGRGVLVIGPNHTFLRYIDQVLPGLGENEVILAGVADLYPGLAPAGPDAPEAVAAVKGDARMAAVLAAALDDRRRPPREPWTIEVGRRSAQQTEVEIEPAMCERALAAATKTGRPHNQARAEFDLHLSSELALRIARRRTEATSMDELTELADAIGEDPAFRAACNTLWPLLTPEQLLSELFRSPSRLAAAMPEFSEAERAALLRPSPAGSPQPSPWTAADIPLLDEAAELLGPLPGRADSADEDVDADADDPRAGRARHTEGITHGDLAAAEAVLADFGGGLVSAQMLLQQYLGDKPVAPLAERAMADRHWAFGHVIVDEAQELSAMAWRLVARRCPSRSMTIVGDLAQSAATGGPRTWGEVLDPYAPGRWRSVELTVNYRTPASIMSLCADVLRAINPDLKAPSAVRDTGVEPWRLRIPAPDDAGALRAVVQREIAQLNGGKLAVIHPAALRAELEGRLADLPGLAFGEDPEALDAPAVLLTPARSKGLEFDAVLVVEPARIVAAHPRGASDLYVALTRATRSLGIVHGESLPDLLPRAALRECDPPTPSALSGP